MAKDWNALTDEAFRQEIAGFIDASLPSDLRGLPSRTTWERSKPWYLILSRAGLIAPSWPVEYGGMGLQPAKHIIYLEEMDRFGAPWMPDHGIMNVGPALIIHGNDAQRKKYLPRILAGEDVWAQGFSEPGAGSDLSGLRTEARIEGDELVINGQKIWTSGAHESNKIFMLVRTNKAVRKQAGISFVLLDREQPGITVQPITMIDGRSAFTITFYDNARAKLEDVVGGIDNGWKVANSLLGGERLWAGSPRHALKYLRILERVAKAAGRSDEPAYRERHGQFVLDTEDLASTYLRTVGSISQGKSHGYEVSILKIFQTELSQRIMQYALELAGDAGGLAGEVDVGGDSLNFLLYYIESRPPTIYGGTVQIHRNILSKHVLRLPS